MTVGICAKDLLSQREKFWYDKLSCIEEIIIILALI